MYLVEMGDVERRTWLSQRCSGNPCVGRWRSAVRSALPRWGRRYLRLRRLCLLDGGQDGAGRRTVKHRLANVAIDDLPAAGSQYEGGRNRDWIAGHLDAKLADDPQLRIAGQRKRQLQPP